MAYVKRHVVYSGPPDQSSDGYCNSASGAYEEWARVMWFNSEWAGKVPESPMDIEFFDAWIVRYVRTIKRLARWLAWVDRLNGEAPGGRVTTEEICQDDVGSSTDGSDHGLAEEVERLQDDARAVRRQIEVAVDLCEGADISGEQYAVMGAVLGALSSTDGGDHG